MYLNVNHTFARRKTLQLNILFMLYIYRIIKETIVFTVQDKKKTKELN